MRPLEWITQMLDQRRLSKPDGRPIYQYRIDDAEYDELAALLKLSVAMGVVNISKMLSWDAAFVLYAAEWWRRSYSGHWGWEGIFDSLGIDYNELSVGQRNEMIETGLHRWLREVRFSAGSRKFLGTVATEGGLPLNQLADSGGWLKLVLNPAISKHVSRGIDIAVLIENYGDLIPRSYRSAEISQILADIVEIVVDLRRNHQLDEKPAPLEWLDKNDPSWREKFPLPIEDAAAKSLLVDLMTTASRTKSSEDTLSPFEVERYLVRAESHSPEFQTRLELPVFVSFSSLGIDIGETGFASVIDIEVYEPGGQSWPWCRGIATTYREKQSLKLSGRPLVLRGSDATKELRLRFKSVGETIHEFELANGEPVDINTPWLFKRVHEKWLLHGTASQSVKGTEAIVFLPDGCSCESVEDHGSVVEHGRLDGGSLFKITGDILCRAKDQVYRLSTGKADSVVTYHLVGKRFVYRSLPSEVFVGVPGLDETNTITGRISRKHSPALLAKPVGADVGWQPLSKVKPGYYEVRLLDASKHILLRRRVGIFSENFSFSLTPDKHLVNSGRISLTGLEGFQVNVPGGPVTATMEKTLTGIDVLLEASALPPLSVDVSLLSAGHHNDLLLSFPYPSKGALLFNPEGQQVQFSTPLFLDDLQGYRIKLYDDQFHAGKKIELMLALVDPFMDRDRVEDIYIQRTLKLKSEMSEFTVFDWLKSIESLMSISSSLSASVQITMVLHGQEIFRLNVRCFENVMDPLWDEGVLELAPDVLRNIKSETLEGTIVNALLIHQPEQADTVLTPQRSAGTVVGEWAFNPEKREEGQWLLYPPESSKLKFRPFIWSVGEQEPHADLVDILMFDSLPKAIKVADQDTRNEAIRYVLNLMAKDLSHKSWSYLTNLWNKTSHLPIATFDLWKLAISEPAFLACLYIKDVDGIVDRLQKELPLIWELVTVADWLAALTLFKEKYMDQFSNDLETLDELVERKISKIESLNMSMISIAQILRLRMLGKDSPELRAMTMPIAAFLQPRLNEEYQNLARRQSESEWPRFLSTTISSKFKVLPTASMSLLATHHSYQQSVVYLPFLLAWRVVSAERDAWPNNSEDLFKIEQLKQFDEDWFCAAFQYLSGWMSQQQMEWI